MAGRALAGAPPGRGVRSMRRAASVRACLHLHGLEWTAGLAGKRTDGRNAAPFAVECARGGAWRLAAGC